MHHFGQLANKLAERANITEGKANEVLEHIFSIKEGEGIIAVELDAGRSVHIARFGKFSTKSRAARKGRNPATGETIDIPAKQYAHFSAAKGLKDRVAQ